MRFTHLSISKKWFTLFILLFAAPCFSQQWPIIQKEAKPWTRWWWMGSAVDASGLNNQLQELHKVGFGGVAVVPIYGAVGYEKKYLPYLSKDWMKALDYTTKKAGDLQMGVDIALGTGWPIGGPQVSIANAATKLILQKYRVAENSKLTEQIIAKDKRGNVLSAASLSLLMAYDTKGNTIDVTDKVDASGYLHWQANNGPYELVAAFVGKTGQKVKRAAPGGEGFVLDHFSKTAVTQYLSSYDTAFGKSNHGVRSFYDDSYEVFEADWTPMFFNEFLKLRGYDLKPYIKNLLEKSNEEITARIKADYRNTLSDLLVDHFANNYTNWVHRKKSMNTNESHGAPGNLLDLYAAVDIPEAEIFGSSKFDFPGIRRDSADIRNVDPDPIMLQFASSAAHVMGKKLVSNETFTWLTEHFKTAWSQCKPEVENTFLAGINHVFYHGTTYSPTTATWPGWLFYASVNFVPSNSLWPHIKGLNEYVTRCQSVLQAGKSDNEILAYWPVYDQWQNASGMDMPFKVHNIDEWLTPTSFYKNIKDLQAIGYSIDFASDKMLLAASVKNGLVQVASNGANYKILLVAETNFMPLSTLQNMIRLAKQGTKVIMQGFPKNIPGLQGADKKMQEQMNQLISSLPLKKINNQMSEAIIGKGSIIVSNNMQAALGYAKIERETLTDLRLKFIRRSINHGKYYYIVNHTAQAIQQNINLQTSAQQVWLLNPQTGESGVAKFATHQNATQVLLQLAPGEAMIVQTSTLKPLANTASLVAHKNYEYTHHVATPIVLNNSWEINFSNGGPFIPKSRTLNKLQPWTSILGDSSLLSFSGTGTYTTHYTLASKNADDYELVLDKLYESAKVIVNGQDAGLIWSIPYTLKIGKYLHAGNNEIKIEVNNLMANRIAYLDRNKIEWRKYHEINFVNINYKTFDASSWKTQISGLDGTAILVPLFYK